MVISNIIRYGVNSILSLLQMFVCPSCCRCFHPELRGMRDQYRPVPPRDGTGQQKWKLSGTGRDGTEGLRDAGRDGTMHRNAFVPRTFSLLFVEKKIVFPMIFLETVSPSAKTIEFTVSGPTRVEVATGFSAGSGSALLNSLWWKPDWELTDFYLVTHKCKFSICNIIFPNA